MPHSAYSALFCIKFYLFPKQNIFIISSCISDNFVV